MAPHSWWHRGLSLRWLSWWCPALPYPGGCSTIGAGGLSFRVRYGAGRGSPAMTTRTGLVGACPTVPAVPVWGWWCRGCVPRVLFSCVPRPLVHRCGADQRVWWGLVVDRIVDAHPHAGGWSVACSRVPDARSLARSFACARVCVCCVGLLVPVSSTGHPASTPGLSTRSSTGGLPHHPSRGGVWRPGLGDGFPLRCLQRLPLPDVANQPCPWRDNWHTRGPSVPVLSY